MFLQFFVCLLLVSFASGQAAQPTPPAPATPNGAPTAPTEPGKAPESKAPEIKVGPDDPVLTIKGYCADATLAGDACKTVLTRGQFEKLAEALQHGSSRARRSTRLNSSHLGISY